MLRASSCHIIGKCHNLLALSPKPICLQSHDSFLSSVYQPFPLPLRGECCQYYSKILKTTYPPVAVKFSCFCTSTDCFVTNWSWQLFKAGLLKNSSSVAHCYCHDSSPIPRKSWYSKSSSSQNAFVTGGWRANGNRKARPHKACLPEPAVHGQVVKSCFSPFSSFPRCSVQSSIGCIISLRKGYAAFGEC